MSVFKASVLFDSRRLHHVEMGLRFIDKEPAIDSLALPLWAQVVPHRFCGLFEEHRCEAAVAGRHAERYGIQTCMPAGPRLAHA